VQEKRQANFTFQRRKEIMSRIPKLFLILGMVLSLAITACGPTAAPEPAPAAEAPAAAEAPMAEPILAVTGMVNQELNLTEADLLGMDVVTITAEHPKNGSTEYTGVYLNDLLEKAGIGDGAGALVMTASDGFSAEVALSDVQACADCLIAMDGGTLNMVMPGMSSKAWVKDVTTFELIEGEMAAPEPPANPTLILATTTSTQDSGLLDVLVPMFQQQTGYLVQTVAVGTGAALKMAEEGNADVLLVHAPASEKALMDAGWGKDRMLVMHNDFVIVGSADDPAAIKGVATAVEAFQKISDAGADFITRGDDSGTNKMEISLWGKTSSDPNGQAWYIDSGQGMGATLTIASEKQAYTLTDRATFLANSENLNLEILVEGDAALLNVYHVITVNPDKWPKSNYDGAIAFAKFMTDPATQKVIGEFGVDKFGQPLFFPDAEKTDADLGLE
jgi:tungstate transport system substrate-binding protein